MSKKIVTKTDFLAACDQFFPGHDIVFTHSRISDRQFTDCMVGEKLVMRYCPPDKYDVPQTVILFPEGEEPLRCMLQEDLRDILKNLKESDGKLPTV
jgi:hypothetical protein